MRLLPASVVPAALAACLGPFKKPLGAVSHALLACSLLVTGCASMQEGCARNPWLLCGDRVTVRRAHVYLDDPAFLYRNKAPARRDDGIFSFGLSLFFNPHRLQGLRMTAALRSAETPVAECRVASGPRAEERPGKADDFAALDSAYLPVLTARKERVSLRFLCRDYRPRWGREDTLELRFAPPSGAPAADSAVALSLPFTTGFRGRSIPSRPDPSCWSP